MSHISVEDAEIGRFYTVSWDDCCTKGSFSALLVAKNYVPDPPEPEPFLENVTFSNGVTIGGNCAVLEEDGASGAAMADASASLIREILEALCRNEGISLDSLADPGTPARNYELALRLGIGRVFGIAEETR
jgi:hypothetical protein